MRKRFIMFLCAGLIGVCVLSSQATAALLGSYNIDVGMQSIYENNNVEHANISISLENAYVRHTLFDDVLLTPDNTGQTFWANKDNYSDFINFVGLLTNGNNEQFTIKSKTLLSIGEAIGYGLQYEENDIFGNWGINGTDLAGFNINSISITFNDISFNSPTNTSNYLWIYHLNADLAVHGTPVPEPASMLLLGSGLIGLVGLKKKSYHLN